MPMLWTKKMDDSDYLRSLVESMPRRLQTVLEKNGNVSPSTIAHGLAQCTIAEIVHKDNKYPIYSVFIALGAHVLGHIHTVAASLLIELLQHVPTRPDQGSTRCSGQITTGTG